MSPLIGVCSGLAALGLAAFGLAGVGRLVLAALSPDPALSRRLGACIPVGLSIYLAGCGLLEFLSTASPWFSTAFLVAGSAAWIGLTRRDRRTRLVAGRQQARHRPSTLFRATVALTALVGLLFVVNACVWSYNNIDDLHGYLVLYERMRQLGALGTDPFTYRRFEMGLGGGIYVYLLHPWAQGPAEIRVIDIGLGTVSLVLLAVESVWTEGRLGWAALAAGLAALVIVALAPSVNMTPEVLGITMLVGLLQTALALVPFRPSVGRGAILGLYAFGLICLKTTFLVPTMIVLLAISAVSIRTHGLRVVVLESLVAGSLALALMTPWMVVSYRAVGTALFPVLGIGRLSAVEVSSFTAPADYVKSFGRIAMLMLIPLGMGVRLLRHRAGAAELFGGLVAVGCLAAFAAVQLKYTVAGYRYGYAAAAALLLVYLCWWLRSDRSPVERGAVAAVLTLVVANMAAYPVFEPHYFADTFTRGVLHQAVFPTDALSAAQMRARQVALSRLQDAIPPGAPTLVRMDTPFLLNFGRNPLHVMDWPGAIGPLEGPPASADPAEWLRYLRAAGMRYIVYSYRNAAGTANLGFRDLADHSESAWLRFTLIRTLDVQWVLDQLMRQLPVVYDDGQEIVVRVD